MVVKSTQAARELWKQTTLTAELVSDDRPELDWYYVLQVEWNRILISGGENGPAGKMWLEKKFWVNGKLEETFIFDSFGWPSN